MIGYRTNPPPRMGVMPDLGNVTALPPPPIDADVEHCLWAASAGYQPLDVILALGMRWPSETPPGWADALLAVRVAIARLNRLHRRAA